MHAMCWRDKGRWANSQECGNFTLLLRHLQRKGPAPLLELMCNSVPAFLKPLRFVAARGLSMGNDGFIHIIDVDSWSVMRDVPLQSLERLITGIGRNFHIFDAATLKVLKKIEPSIEVSRRICEIAWSPDGKSLAVACFGDDVCILDAESLAVLKMKHFPVIYSESGGYQGGGQVVNLEYAPSGGLIAAAGNHGYLRILHAESLEVVRNIIFPPVCGTLLSVTYDHTEGFLAVGCSRGFVHTLSSSLDFLIETKKLPGAVSSLLFADEGNYILASGHQRISVLDLSSLEELHVKHVSSLEIMQLSLMPLGTEMLLGSLVADLNHNEDVTIEVVDHTEPSASVDPEVAALQSDVAWAERVEERLAALPDHEDTHAAAIAPERIFMLRFGSAPSGGDGPQKFRKALAEGSAFYHCRKALEDAGFSFVLPEGAMIFVTPNQYTDVRHALIDQEVHPYNVIVSESFEYLIEEVLASFSFQMRPKFKPGTKGRCELSFCCRRQRKAADEDVFEELLTQVLCEKRTFLCLVPIPCQAQSVVQSTTEVVVDRSISHYDRSRGSNPRRMCVKP